MLFRPPRDGISVRHPATILATWFWSGRLRKAPGTWGSLAALPFGWALGTLGGPAALLACSALCFLVGWWTADIYVRRTHADDPGEVVVDEVAGQWLALAAAPLEPLSYLVAFAAFRLFDIWKPWPVSWADRRLGGGLGVMADDMLAGLYALAVTALFVWMKG